LDKPVASLKDLRQFLDARLMLSKRHQCTEGSSRKLVQNARRHTTAATILDWF